MPEYCIYDNSENRQTFEAYGFSISDSQINNNEICFRSNNQELVQEMFQEIHDKQLEKEFELQKIKEQNRNEVIQILLQPMYFFPILTIILLLGLAYFSSNNNQ